MGSIRSRRFLVTAVSWLVPVIVIACVVAFAAYASEQAFGFDPDSDFGIIAIGGLAGVAAVGIQLIISRR